MAEDSEDTKTPETPERRPKLMKFKRAGYYFFLVVLVCALVVQSITLVLKWREGPTYVSTEIVEQRNMSFPAITFCPENEPYKRDVLMVSYVNQN